MTTTSTPVTLSAELAAATPTLDEDEQRLALALYRLLADGQPVEHDALASHAKLEARAVADALTRWPGVYLDDSDRIIGFLGLSIQPMPHRLIVGGHVLYAWCAWDTLFLPELLGKPTQVESQCPSTRRPISLSVNGTEISDVHPAETVLSFLHRDAPFDADSITTFCHYVHFFASPTAAATWTAQHDHTSPSRCTTGWRSRVSPTARDSPACSDHSHSGHGPLPSRHDANLARLSERPAPGGGCRINL